MSRHETATVLEHLFDGANAIALWSRTANGEIDGTADRREPFAVQEDP